MAKFEGNKQDQPVRDTFGREASFLENLRAQKTKKRRKRRQTQVGGGQSSSRLGSTTGSLNRGAPSSVSRNSFIDRHVAPPGMEHVVKKLKRKKGITNPYAVAWSMHDKEKEKHNEGIGGLLRVGPGRDAYQRNLRTLDYIAAGGMNVQPSVIDRLHSDAVEDIERQYPREEKYQGVNLQEVWRHVLDEAKKEAMARLVEKHGAINRVDLRRRMVEGQGGSVLDAYTHDKDEMIPGKEFHPDQMDPKSKRRTKQSSVEKSIRAGGPNVFDPKTKKAVPNPELKDKHASKQGVPCPALKELEEGGDQSEYDEEEVQQEVAGKGKGLEKQKDEDKNFIEGIDALDGLIERFQEVA